MRAKPKCPWLARVYASMLATEAVLTSKQVESMFGRSPSARSTGGRMSDGVLKGWFVCEGKASGDLTGSLYRAVAKTGRAHVPPGPRKADERKCRDWVKEPQVAEDIGRYASIWGVAADVQAPVPLRQAPAFRTALSPLAQWVAA